MVVHMMENCAQKCPTFGRTYVLKINKNIDRGDIEIIINYTCKITFANARFFFLLETTLCTETMIHSPYPNMGRISSKGASTFFFISNQLE